MNSIDRMGLPGPRRFVQRAIECVHEGKNVGLFFPSFPELDYISILTRAESSWFCEIIDAAEYTGIDPLAVMSQRFDNGNTPSRTIYDLVQQPALGGKLIIITARSDTTLPRWLRFLDDWTRVSNDMPVYARGLLCVISIGCSTQWLPTLPLFQEQLSWSDGFVTSVDALSYTHDALEGSVANRVERLVLGGVIASVAGTDFSIIDALACQPASVVFKPGQILNQIAKDRGWSANAIPACSSAQLYTGKVEVLDGQLRMNSAALAACGRHSEIQNRVWKGQVATLFPLLEECRQFLLRELGKTLRIPVVTPFGRIDDLYNLEFNHIADQLATTTNSKAANYKKTVYRLKNLRNSLAHLEPVSSDDFDSRLFAQLLGIG